MVSLTMIVRNESANLPDCLRSVAGLFDETVIVDTGSTDDTKAIAASFGARVFDFPWCDDFSAARNAALDHATGEWLFWMDADDRLEHASRNLLKSVLAFLGEPCAYTMPLRVLYPDNEQVIYWKPHLFHRSLGLRWIYRVHEQLSPTPSTLVKSEVWMKHVGYCDHTVRLSKSERNFRLLKMELEERPDDPTVHYHLGSVWLLQGDGETALPHLEACRSLLAKSGQQPEYRLLLLFYLGQCYAAQQRWDLVAEIESQNEWVANQLHSLRMAWVGSGAIIA